MKWRHQEEAKNTTTDACTTSSGDVIRCDVICDVIDDDIKTDRSSRTGCECRVPSVQESNNRKPASVMSVADILDLRVVAEVPSNDGVTSGQNSADPRRL